MASFLTRHENTEIERTCRYGHGPLISLTDKCAERPYVSIALGFGDKRHVAPEYAGPFFWHVCATCGYTEIIDGDPVQTINALGGLSG